MILSVFVVSGCLLTGFHTKFSTGSLLPIQRSTMKELDATPLVSKRKGKQKRTLFD
jgi:hypothetical protein